MKALFLLVLTVFGFTSFSQSQEKINIPPGIVYKYCDNSIVEKAKQLITANIKDSSKYSLVGNILFVGPVLWQRFKNINRLNSIDGGNVTLQVDAEKLSAKMTQELEDTKKVWSELRKEINGQTFIIRKLQEKELKYYWSVISFDIEEPLLIVETKEHKYILNLLKDKMQLMWLDEVPQ